MAHKEWEYITTVAPTMNGGTAPRLASFCGWEPNSTNDVDELYDLHYSQTAPVSKDAGKTIDDSVFGRWMDAVPKVLRSVVWPDKEPRTTIFLASIVFNGNVPEKNLIFRKLLRGSIIGQPDVSGNNLIFRKLLTPPLTPPQYSGNSQYCSLRSPEGE